MKTQELIERFKTWNGNAWLKDHLAFLKGTYQISHSLPVKREKKKAPKIHYLPFFPNVSHASSEIRDLSNQKDRDWRDDQIVAKLYN
jgi:hypothetical protein